MSQSISLEAASISLPTVSIIQPVIDEYESIAFDGTKPVLIFVGREIETSENIIRFLKALTLASVNRNQEWAELLAKCALQLSGYVAKRQERLIIPLSLEASKFETLVISELNKFIEEVVLNG